MGSNLVKYQKWEPETVEEERKALDASGSEFMKLKVGKNIVRFMPPRLGTRTPLVLVWQHYIEVPGEERPIVFACPRMMLKPARLCAVCTKADELMASQNQADRDLGFKMKHKQRVFANVIDRTNPEAGPRVLGFGKTIYDELLALRENEDIGGDYTDPGDDGFDIVITRKGTSRTDTEYSVGPHMENRQVKTSSIGDESWLELMHDLSKYARVPSVEELAKMLKIDLSTAGSGAVSGAGQSRAKRGGKPTVMDDAEQTDK